MALANHSGFEEAKMQVLPALAHAYDGDHMFWGTGWMWIWGPLTMLAIIAGIIALVLWAVRTKPQNQPHNSRAREILAERYAAGEIDHDEYQNRLSHLQ